MSKAKDLKPKVKTIEVTETQSGIISFALQLLQKKLLQKKTFKNREVAILVNIGNMQEVFAPIEKREIKL